MPAKTKEVKAAAKAIEKAVSRKGKTASKVANMRNQKGDAMSAAPNAVGRVTRKKRSTPVTIRQREEISIVNCQVDFENSALVINPKNRDLFPWLAQIAGAFTSFKWKNLSFEYVPTTDTATSGTIAMAVQADAEKPAFTTDKQIQNHEGSATGSPWEPIKINALSQSTGTLGDAKFIGDVDTAKISGFFDTLQTVASGVLNIATVGLALAGSDLKTDPDPKPTGRLFAEYEVDLWDPDDEPELDQVGISYFTDNGATTFQPVVPAPFEDEPIENPLEIIATGDGDGVTKYNFTTASKYQVNVYTALPSAPANTTGTLLEFVGGTGPDPPVLLGSGVPFWTTDEKFINFSCIVDIQDTAQQSLTLAYGAAVLATAPLSAKVTFQKITDESLSRLHSLLPVGRRGCLPDCKNSSVASYLKDRHFAKKLSSAVSELRIETSLLQQKATKRIQSELSDSKRLASKRAAAVPAANAAGFIGKTPPFNTDLKEDYVNVKVPPNTPTALSKLTRTK